MPIGLIEKQVTEFIQNHQSDYSTANQLIMKGNNSLPGTVVWGALDLVWVCRESKKKNGKFAQLNPDLVKLLTYKRPMLTLEKRLILCNRDVVDVACVSNLVGVGPGINSALARNIKLKHRPP